MEDNSKTKILKSVEVKAVETIKIIIGLLTLAMVMGTCSNDSEVADDVSREEEASQVVVIGDELAVDERNEVVGDVSRGEDVPQVGVNGDELTVDERMEFILNTSGTVHNIVVGTPIEFIQGSLAITPFFHGRSIDEVDSTEYYFRVTDWLFGEEGDEIIRVNSIAGNIFEIDEEYTISLWYAESLFRDETWYNVGSQIWTLPSMHIAEDKLVEFRENVQNLPPNQLERIIDEAEPTLEFLEHVDLAIIVTIRDIEDNTLSDSDSFWLMVEYHQTMYGESEDRVEEHLLNNAIIFGGDFTVGNDYLILTKENFLPVSRHGSAIPYGSGEFYQFIELFELASQENE